MCIDIYDIKKVHITMVNGNSYTMLCTVCIFMSLYFYFKQMTKRYFILVLQVYFAGILLKSVLE